MDFLSNAWGNSCPAVIRADAESAVSFRVEVWSFMLDTKSRTLEPVEWWKQGHTLIQTPLRVGLAQSGFRPLHRPVYFLQGRILGKRNRKRQKVSVHRPKCPNQDGPPPEEAVDEPSVELMLLLSDVKMMTATTEVCVESKFCSFLWLLSWKFTFQKEPTPPKKTVSVSSFCVCVMYFNETARWAHLTAAVACSDAGNSQDYSRRRLGTRWFVWSWGGG